MKNFKFKLDSLLKVREFKEYKIKIDLGKINRDIFALKERIHHLQDNVVKCYLDQSTLVQSGAKGRMLQLYSELISGARTSIKNLERELEQMEKTYEAKLRELYRARGDVKVIENLKTKDFKKFRKDYLKKLDGQIQDIFQTRYGSREREDS